MSDGYVPTKRQRDLAKEVYAETGFMPRFPVPDRPQKPQDLDAFAAALPADERRAAAAAIGFVRGAELVTAEQAELLLSSVLKARYRTVSRAHSDRQTDRQRRATVGTRQPRAFRDRCQRAADRAGMSVNAWVFATLERELQRAQRVPDREPDEDRPWLLS